MPTDDEKTKELTDKFTPSTKKEKKKKEEGGFDEEKFLSLMRKRHSREVKSDKDNRDEAVKDQKFRRAGQKDQWDSEELTRRKKMMRPAIVLDELSRPINQVTGEMRLNKAHAIIVPADDDASVPVSKAYKDLVHEIEYVSKADQIYEYAGDMLCGCAYGAWRILTRYCKDNPFEQEAYLQAIKNPLLVYMDSSAKDKYYADAKYGFVMEWVTKDEWEDLFHDKPFPTAEKFKSMPGTNMELWFEDDRICIGDYYVVEPEKTTFVMLENDDVLTEEEYKKAKSKWQDEQEEILEQKTALWNKAKAIIEMQSMMPPAQQPGLPAGQPPAPPGIPPVPGPAAPSPMPQAAMPGQQAVPQSVPTAPQVPQLPPPPEMPDLPPSLTITKNKKTGKEKRREIDVPKIKHYVVAPDQVLQGPHDIPGEFIPIVLAHGIETNVEGKQEFYSLIRKAKGPQTLLNQIETNKAEIIDMIPKAPWIMTFRQYGPGGELFDAANVENRGALLYEPDLVVDEQGQSHLIPAPQRVNVGQMPVAIFQYANDIKSYIEDSIGIAKADTMNVSTPERTGAATRGKRMASDVGTYHFIDNLNGAIEHSTKILVSMIPEVYDTDRDVRMRGDDESQSFIPINTTNAGALKKVGANPQRYSGIDRKQLEKEAKENPSSDYNNLSKGRYDVFTKVGPSFSTAREEASDQFMTLATQGQRMNPLDKYFAVKHLDLADGGEYAEALKRQIPAKVLPPKEGEDRINPEDSPQFQLQKLKMMNEQAKLKQQELHIKLRMIEIQKELTDKGDKAIKEEKDLRKIINDELQKSMFGDPSGGGKI